MKSYRNRERGCHAAGDEDNRSFVFPTPEMPDPGAAARVCGNDDISPSHRGKYGSIIRVKFQGDKRHLPHHSINMPWLTPLALIPK